MEQSQNYKLGELIQSIKNGNVSAISEIYTLVGRAMKATALAYVRNKIDADDVVQDALVVIVKKSTLFRSNKNAYAWINTIVSNIAKNKIGYTKRRKEVSLETAVNLSTEPFDRNIVVNEIFGLLTEKERQYIIYRFWYECSFEEMAKILHRSKTNVSYNFNKIIAKIKNFYNVSK